MKHLKTFENHINFTSTDDTIEIVKGIIRNSKLPPRKKPTLYNCRMYGNILWLVYGFRFKTIQDKHDKSGDRDKFAEDLKEELLNVENVENVEIKGHGYTEPFHMDGKYSGLHTKRDSIYEVRCTFTEDSVSMSKNIDKYNL